MWILFIIIIITDSIIIVNTIIIVTSIYCWEGIIYYYNIHTLDILNATLDWEAMNELVEFQSQ